MRWALVVAVVVAALAATSARPAGATDECRGLPVCVRVAGPWVVVPSGLATPRAHVDYQLSCPRGFVVGGLDAELSDRAIQIEFAGNLGSPVNPGVTTSRSAVFRATYAGGSPRGPTFRPHLGCVPSASGGSGPVPLRVPQAFPPGQPTVRRVRNVRVRPGSMRVSAACGAGERLLSGWHAVGFTTAAPPSVVEIQGVHATRTPRAARVEVRVRAAAGTSQAVVQAGAVCGGGS